MRRAVPHFRVTRAGYTLAELVIAAGSATFLMAGLGATVLVATAAFRPETNSQHVRTSAAQAQRELLNDLQLATGFSERTSTAAGFSVPDRDGDGRPEMIRYSWSGVSGAPLLYSYNGGAAVPVLNDVRALSLTYLTQPVAATVLPVEQTGSQILMLVNDSKNPSSDELSWKSQIETWGFVVALFGANNTAAEFETSLKSSKAIFLGSQLNASNFKFATDVASISIGIVNLHPDFVDDLGFASDCDTSSTNSVSVSSTSHYIMQGVGTGNQSVVMFFSEMARLNTNPAKSLNQLATVGNEAALVTINPNKALYDGRSAAGRRVMLPWVKVYDPIQLTPTGQKLTAQAISWATGLGSASDPQLKNFGCETVFTSSNGSKEVQYSTKANLTEKGMLKSISAYVGGANDQVRFAIYTDKSGQPDKLLVQTGVGMTTTSMAWVTLTVPDTQLDPGNYWLAFTFKSSNQLYRFDSAGTAGSRSVSNAAVQNGYLSTWGTSSSSSNGTRSIYATYEVLP